MVIKKSEFAAAYLPTVPKRDSYHYLQPRSEQLGRIKGLVDGYKARTELLDGRRDNIQKQNLKKYQMEYDRLAYALKNYAYPGFNKVMLEKRQQDLRDLGIKGVSGMS